MEPPSITSPAKPPLITPSASPPPAPVFAHRMSDNARPLGRQRLFSTPRRIIHDDGPSSSTSRIQTPVDIGKEREASVHKLLDHWASLAERYTRRLDEDDIVDLQTGKVTRDYGVLRSSRKCEFGALAAPPTGYLTADEGSDSEDDEDDVYDQDELDAFADTYSDTDAPDLGTQSNLEPEERSVPLVAPLDPADAADLQEFMDAEQRLREMCGSDFGEEKESDLDDPLPEAFDDQTEGEEDQHSIEEGEEYISEDDAGDGDANGNAGKFVLPPAIVDWTSEDELDVWEVDETNDPGPVVKKENEPNNSDSDIEIIEPPMFFTPTKPHPPVPSKSTPTRHPSKMTRQLHTPPQSHASSGSSLTPMRDQSLEESTTCSSRTIITASSSPPRSSSAHSFPETPTKKAIPRLNLALLSKKPGNLSKESPRPSSAQVRKSTPVQRSTPKSKPSFPNPKLKPIVLLTPRKSEKSVPSTSHAIQPRHRALSNKTEEQSSAKSYKGKERALDIQNEDHEVEPSSPSKTLKIRGRPRKVTSVVDSSCSTKSPAIPIQASPSKRVIQDVPPHRAPSHEDSDDPILISPPSHRSSQPAPIAKGEVSLRSRTSTGSLKTPESYPEGSSFAHELKPIPLIESRKFMASPGLRKRKRTTSDLATELPFGQSPEKKTDRKSSPSRHPPSHASSSRFIDDARFTSRSPKKRSSSRHRRRESDTQSERESESSASERDGGSQRRRSRSRCKTQPASLHYSNPYASQYQAPQNYPPIQDARAQLIITQAMQQLSALVGAPWIPGHPYPGAVPHTPTHRHVSERPSNNQFVTPTHHHHPYPYSYDPQLSHATLPPDSSDNESSPENSPPARRRTLVRRSRSRGRRVSFVIEEDNKDSDVMELSTNPPGLTLSKGISRSQKGTMVTTDSVPTFDADGAGSMNRRGQTPGPSIKPPVRGNGTTSSTNKPKRRERDSGG
ncbi:hypothetical protein M413DRAFT_401292 [Hebeloma cylindrosporum]|uniref:Uncharacterized protein n=1 Tax=Hebeloma cylindrosporum TaxID=76867 RepID=A0A0C3C327_HEBCY|nr:hypothetical protein M413DRAFT_401292 [Hebeloma cylindrosporum h7]